MILETKRLLLRPWEEADAKDLYRYACDPQVGPPAGWQPHTSVENSRQIIEDILSAEGTFAIVIKANGPQPVGSVGVFRTDAVADREEPEIGYWLARPFWGHGYAPEAVQYLLRCCFAKEGTRRVWCAHYAGNDKSRRVIEKCGFTRQFIREQDVPAMGERRLTYYYAIRREEWRQKAAKYEMN